MVKEKYLEAIKKETGIAKNAIDKVITAFIDIMKNNLILKKKINIANFGTLSISRFKPKLLFSPYDGRTIKQTNIYKGSFRLSKDFKEYIKKESE